MRRRTILAAGRTAPLAACGADKAGSGADNSASSPNTPPSPSPSTTAPSSSATSPSPAASPSADPRVKAVLDRLTPRQLAGQCISVGVVPADSPGYIADLISTHSIGGVLLLGHWTRTDKLTRMLDAIRSTAPQGLRPIIATDHEGGEIQNIRIPSVTRLPSQESLAQMPVPRVEKIVEQGCRQIADLGVTMVYSPVADVIDPDLGTRNKPIAAHHRGFGTNPQVCGRYTVAVIRAHRRAGIISTAKHFPGIGRIVKDTDFAADGITDARTRRDGPFLEPFRMAIQADVGAVMTAAATYPRIDPDNLAIFSHTVMTDVLRNEMGFDGLIVSDDLGSSISVFSEPGGAACP